MIYSYDTIEHLHLELSTLCNAKCPLCPRNFCGYPHNDGYPETNLTLEQVKKIFDIKFIKQLKYIVINGNYGDCIMNNDTIEIIKYFRNNNPNINLSMHTNGGARNKDWWIELAKTKTIINFCIDGLEDTHSLYRQNTLYTTVLRNAKYFIDAGGWAIWKYIIFDHNKHQINDARKLADEYGFWEFETVDHGRSDGPVYDEKGNIKHIIGSPDIVEENVHLRLEKHLNNQHHYSQYTKPCKNINCEVKEQKSLYIAANGEAYPCCYTGFYPKTSIHFGNDQLKKIVNNNNALEYGLEDSIKWFDKIEDSWNIDSYDKGRILACDQNCGNNNDLFTIKMETE